VLETILAARGLGSADLLRLRLFVADLNDRAEIERALDTRLGPQRPAVSVIELPTGSLPRDVAVSLDAVAADGGRARRGQRRQLAPYSARVGPWVFVGAVTAPPPSLPRREHALSEPPDPDTEPRALFAHMQALLREQGAELRDVVRVGSWLTFPMRDYGPFARVRTALVAEAGLLPASAGVQVGRVGLAGQRLACEAVAFAPEDRADRIGAPPAADRTDAPPAARPTNIPSAADRGDAPPAERRRSRLADFYVDARAAGGYVFTSGEVPDGRGSVRAQAAEVYERLGSHLAAHGARAADVVQQTVFVRHAADGEAVLAAGRVLYGAHPPPPATLIAVADLGFCPGCDVEIELVASAGGHACA
jgi:enamine deaminase RidA (YjgF/YER057c/UK114 family)